MIWTKSLNWALKLVFGFSGYKVPSLRSRPSDLAILLEEFFCNTSFSISLYPPKFVDDDFLRCEQGLLHLFALNSWNRKQIWLMYCNLCSVFVYLIYSIIAQPPASKKEICKKFLSCPDAVRIQNVRYLIGLQPGTPKSSWMSSDHDSSVSTLDYAFSVGILFLCLNVTCPVFADRHCVSWGRTCIFCIVNYSVNIAASSIPRNPVRVNLVLIIVNA